MRRERMTKRVARHRLQDAGRPRGPLERALYPVWIDMMAPTHAAPWITSQAAGGKCVLPTRLDRGLGKLAPQCIRHPGARHARGPVLRMYFEGACHLQAQFLRQYIRQRHASILSTLAVAHCDLAPREVDVLGAQPRRLHDPQPASVEQP